MLWRVNKMTKYGIAKNLLLISLMMASGCVSSQYAVPDLKSSLAQYESAAPADSSWWLQYKNNELNALIDKALLFNPDYLRAALNIDKELYNLNLQTLNLFPTLSGDLGLSSQSAVRRTDNFSSNFSGGLGLSYEVDLYGKIRDLKNAQEFEYLATVQDKEAARLALINSVVDLYFNLEYLDNSIDLTEKNINTYRQLYKIAEEKYTRGKSDNLEYLQAKQSLLSEENTLISLETSRRELESSLRNILNIGPEEKLNLTYGDILKQHNINVDIDVPLSVLANRPDLIASQYRLEKAFKNLEAEEKNWYPNISLSGAVNTSSDKARTTFDFPFLLGAVSVDLPFLDWNRVQNNVKISEADYKLAFIDFRDTLNQALNEVAYYFYAYQQAQQQYKNIEKNYNNAVGISKYYQTRYNNGKIEFRYYLEALNTENTLKKSLIEKKYQIITYENYIYKAMGGKY